MASPSRDRQLVAGTHADGAAIEFDLAGAFEQENQFVDVVYEVVPNLVGRINPRFTCESAVRPAGLNCFQIDFG
jgi:hypothetical protein